MEPGSFEQRRLLTRRTYVVGPNGVAYQHRTPFSKFAGTVRFDEMGAELDAWTSGAGVRWLWGAGVLLVFAIILVASGPGDGEPRPYAMAAVWFGLALAALGRWLAARIHWVGYAPLYLFAARPSREEIEAFLDLVHRAWIRRNLSAGRAMVDTGRWTEAQFRMWQEQELGAVLEAPPDDPGAGSAYL